jgi:hypothetical protein
VEAVPEPYSIGGGGRGGIFRELIRNYWRIWEFGEFRNLENLGIWRI